MTTAIPTFKFEEELWQKGIQWVAGIDEAGRGALAGPVVAAAVVIPPFSKLGGIWATVRDSKQLSAKQRQQFERDVQSQAAAWGVGVVDAGVIDQIGIAAATRQAMVLALESLTIRPQHLLIDWVKLPGVHIAQQSFIKADVHIVSVAAASILAKVHRDRLMIEFATRFPQYGFDRHKGYGSSSHLAAIKEFGGCAIHRHSFAPLLQPSLFS